MTNLYFDILPYDIQKEIYGIRLSNALARTYYRKVAQKVALAYLVLRLQKLNFGEFWGNSMCIFAISTILKSLRQTLKIVLGVVATFQERFWKE